jgi:hypothetical protein
MTHGLAGRFFNRCVFAALFFSVALFASNGVRAEEPSLAAKLYWDHSVLRAEQEEILWLYLEDLGDVRPALSVKLKTPTGVELLEDAEREIPASAWEKEPVYVGKRPSAMEPHPATRISWRLRSSQPLRGVVEVTVAGDGLAASDTLTAVFRKTLAPVQTDYVPEPIVADSERHVGMIYCPLWKPGDHYGWHMMERSMPWRKPALGWYDESLPEVTDWEIKWMLEHGVDFIFYCWYRAYGNEGKPVEQLFSHGIHDGLFNARYGDRIKFCIMWTNTDYSGIASREDLMDNLLPFWIETYFKRPNYLLIDNKPVLPVYDIRRLIKDLGSEAAVKETLDLMREACVKEGFDGLWITGESRHWWPDYLKTMAACGFDASFAYVWNNVPDGASDKEAHDTILSNHQKRIEWNLLPDIPTVSAMWDPSLWEQYAQPGQSSAHYHMSPEGFRRVCEDVKSLTDKLPEKSLARRMILVDNWNEWGEGHYLAPCREHGFDYLDVLREVFTNAPQEHTDLIPEDFGLGPYEAAYDAWVDGMRTTSEQESAPQPTQE